MSRPYLRIGRLARELSNGKTEDVHFEPGANLLVGRPNTGKTKWLQTLDYMLGDPGENPFEAAVEDGLADKYRAAVTTHLPFPESPSGHQKSRSIARTSNERAIERGDWPFGALVGRRR